MKTKSQSRHFGYWPDGAASTVNQPAELTAAARRMAIPALEELNPFGVTVWLDKLGQAHLNTTRIPSRDAGLAIENTAI
ncbi:MAG: hypothetical protein WB715_13705 [Roseiarcus sp.]|uniref:hypothetical protein n=1 Tax=Roseiarcus sp. TaxID=1969460 RepID=UPI003C4AAF9B